MPDIQLEQPQLLTQKQFFDSRGKFIATPQEPRWIQDNISVSHRGVFRGMHFQLENFAQAKMVRVLSGSVIDIIVDLRNTPENKNYLNITHYHLSAFNNSNHQYALYVPKGFAHGFIALEDNTIFHYLVDSPYNPQLDRSLHWKSFPLIDEICQRNQINPEELLVSPKDDQAIMLDDWLIKNERVLPV